MGKITRHYDSGGRYKGYSKNSNSGDIGSDISNALCFIATAVYGDINAPQLDVLRNYRDNVLMKRRFGRVFVGLYYSGAGKSIADFISTKARFAIPIIRKELDILVENNS